MVLFEILPDFLETKTLEIFEMHGSIGKRLWESTLFYFPETKF